ncbi:MAG: non-canonical purine NTP pyrophosphatase [Verrucomicrobiae bacterium]|nr:non-canonical purine NTP pyrophosphatase [Verrucomicrobiae bacterium]
MHLVVATHNQHKVAEIRACLGDQFRVLSLRDFPGAPVVIEDQPTFAANAAKKARVIANWLAAQPERSDTIFVIADDSGLEVDVLNGAPGVNSARFAALDRGENFNSTDAENNAKLLKLLEGVPAELRTARFRCAIALVPVQAGPDQGHVRGANVGQRIAEDLLVFEGVCEGQVLDAPRGTAGFGYDPLFLPKGYNLTFAELGAEVKNTISHRARALEKLKAWFSNHRQS